MTSEGIVMFTSAEAMVSVSRGNVNLNTPVSRGNVNQECADVDEVDSYVELCLPNDGVYHP